MSVTQRHEIWWERWGGGYKPVNWKGWTSVAAFLCGIPTVLVSSSEVMALLGRADDRTVPALCVVGLWVFMFWFVERHTEPAGLNFVAFIRAVVDRAMRRKPRSR